MLPNVVRSDLEWASQHPARMEYSCDENIRRVVQEMEVSPKRLTIATKSTVFTPAMTLPCALDVFACATEPLCVSQSHVFNLPCGCSSILLLESSLNQFEKNLRHAILVAENGVAQQDSQFHVVVDFRDVSITFNTIAIPHHRINRLGPQLAFLKAHTKWQSVFGD